MGRIVSGSGHVRLSGRKSWPAPDPSHVRVGSGLVGFLVIIFTSSRIGSVFLVRVKILTCARPVARSGGSVFFQVGQIYQVGQPMRYRYMTTWYQIALVSIQSMAYAARLPGRQRERRRTFSSRSPRRGRRGRNPASVAAWAPAGHHDRDHLCRRSCPHRAPPVGPFVVGLVRCQPIVASRCCSPLSVVVRAPPLVAMTTTAATRPRPRSADRLRRPCLVC
jgi:hypothetical protein